MPPTPSPDIKAPLRLDPRVTSLLLFCGYLWALNALLPEGINQNFITILLILCSVVTAVGVLVSLRASKQMRGSEPLPPSAQKFPFGDLLLLSIPLTPVIQFLLINQQSMDLIDNLGLVVISTLLFAATALLLPWLLRRWLSYPVALLLILALSYILVNMAALARANNWHLAGEFLPQFGLWLIVLTVCGFLYRADRSALRGLALCFLFATTVHTAWQGPQDTLDDVTASSENMLEQTTSSTWERVFGDQKITNKPHIFLMTYDSYVGNETLLQYGIDNSPQEQYLQDSGFQIYPGIYSVAAASRSSMSRMLGTTKTLKGVAGFSPMLDVLKTQGYTTMGIFQNDYYFRGVGVGYDRSFPPPSRPSLALARAIVEGQFRHDVSFESVPHAEFLRDKRLAIESATQAPKFMYTHTGPGHSQNSGKCRDNEVDLFRQRLETANQEMRDDVASIMASHPNALIIVNGDHGPSLTKNCTALSLGDYRIEEVTPLDIQDRFGTFLAIRWPENRRQYPDAQLLVLQDVVPAIFSYLYDQSMVTKVRRPPEIRAPWNDAIMGVSVAAGVIVGGSHNGERLYEPSTLVQR